MHASKNNPLISVIVPNYNHARYLPERLSSIYNQTYKNIEVIILDDASTDNSLKIITQETKNWEIPYRLIRSEQNSGNPFKQWKKGLDLAKGQLIWIAESDDSAKPKFLENCLRLLKLNPTLKLVFTASQIIDAKESICYTTKKRWQNLSIKQGQTGTISQNEFFSYLPLNMLVTNISACLFEKSSALLFDPKNNEKYTKWADVFFIGNLVIQGRGVGVIHEELNYFRIHNANYTASWQKPTSKEQWQYIISTLHYLRHNKMLTKQDIPSKRKEILEYWWRHHSLKKPTPTATDRSVLQQLNSMLNGIYKSYIFSYLKSVYNKII